MIEPEADQLTTAGTAVVDGSTADGSFAARDSVLARVRSKLPEFTGALQRVAENILSDPAGAARATIVELAERSGTSPATITRFCRAMDFEGYADLRLGIAAETGRMPGGPAGRSTSAGRSSRPTRSHGCSARSWPPTRRP